MTETHKRFVCGKPMPKAKNGAYRGFCTRSIRGGAHGNHGNGTCPDCGVKIIKETAYRCGWCRKCKTKYSTEWARIKYNRKVRVSQIPGTKFVFPKCGCFGILPKQKNEVDKFVSRRCGCERNWCCRVSEIIHGSIGLSKRYGCVSISPNTPHSVIRKLMDESNCERCNQSLKWEFGMGKTPHLHHNHETGEIYGFTHHRCNPRALEVENERLRKENAKLRVLVTKAA
jgi:hypothetical protein